VRVGEADTVFSVSCTERIGEGLAVPEGIFRRHGLTHGREVDRLIKYDIFANSDFTICPISVHFNILVCFGYSIVV
jgi:hypothetical protein